MAHTYGNPFIIITNIRHIDLGLIQVQERDKAYVESLQANGILTKKAWC